MSVDITVSMILRILLAGIFLRAVWHKLRDLPHFVTQVDAYDLLPPRLVQGVAYALVVLECALVLALPVPPWWQPPALAAVLLGVYALAMAINLLRGEEDLDCGCAGAAAYPPGISWRLVGRNALLMLAAAIAALPIAPRAWSLLDVGTIVLGSAAVALLYAGIAQAMANRQRQALYGAARGRP